MLKIYLIKRFFYYFYGEKFFKRLDYSWANYPTRSEIIKKIIDKKKYESYLELGCDKDSNFSKIKIKNKIGVDSKLGGTLKMTSDEFFENNEIYFDCIFIDALHIYEQVRKDILNSVKFLNAHGIIIVHDCLPKKIWNQIVPQIYGHWNGDVWKAIVEARTMKDIDTYTCKADHGLGIILKRPNKNLLSLDTNDFKKLKFKDYYINHKKFMNLIEASDLEKIL
jgi:glutamate mutase epsilon subunit